MGIARNKRANILMAVAFSASDWLNNSIVIIRSGLPTVPGEIGPHELPLNRFYETSIYKYLPSSRTKEVGLTIVHDRATGNITFSKAAAVAAFSGVAFIKTY
jgi:hypothetical protein